MSFDYIYDCRKARAKLDTGFSRIFWWGHSYDCITIWDVTYWTLCAKYTTFPCKFQVRICGRIMRLCIESTFLCSVSPNSLQNSTSEGTLSWLFTEFIQRLIVKISNINSEGLITTEQHEKYLWRRFT